MALGPASCVQGSWAFGRCDPVLRRCGQTDGVSAGIGARRHGWSWRAVLCRCRGWTMEADGADCASKLNDTAAFTKLMGWALDGRGRVRGKGIALCLPDCPDRCLGADDLSPRLGRRMVRATATSSGPELFGPRMPICRRSIAVDLLFSRCCQHYSGKSGHWRGTDQNGCGDDVGRAAGGRRTDWISCSGTCRRRAVQGKQSS